jgi:hypothetical protein
MSCPRCAGTVEAGGARWCKACEQLYESWVRRHASDIVWQALTGTVVVSAIGIGLPLLGVGWLVAAAGAFAGFGTILGLSRLTRRRRRRQFLEAPLPRAYLPAPK